MSGRSSAARAVAQSDGGVLASWDSVNKELYSVLCTMYYVTVVSFVLASLRAFLFL